MPTNPPTAMKYVKLCETHWPDHPWFEKAYTTKEGLSCGHHVRFPGYNQLVHMYPSDCATLWAWPQDGWQRLLDHWLPIIAAVAVVHFMKKFEKLRSRDVSARLDMQPDTLALMQSQLAWEQLCKDI